MGFFNFAKWLKLDFKAIYRRFRKDYLEDWLINRALHVPQKDVDKAAEDVTKELAAAATKLIKKYSMPIPEAVVQLFINELVSIAISWAKEVYRKLEVDAAEDLLGVLDKAMGCKDERRVQLSKGLEGQADGTAKSNHSQV